MVDDPTLRRRLRANDGGFDELTMDAEADGMSYTNDNGRAVYACPNADVRTSRSLTRPRQGRGPNDGLPARDAVSTPIGCAAQHGARDGCNNKGAPTT